MSTDPAASTPPSSMRGIPTTCPTGICTTPTAITATITDGTVHPFADERLEAAIDLAARQLGLRLSSHEVILRGTPRA